ncbi:MAG: anhydro-N-acetylmuramic acid kinase [Gammaproteobacteria bacterium]|nr:anhydro-N-acetylmuramic acid kinase [Gammaproteobacteria bacterium]
MADKLYIGLMSGTSMDGVDAVVAKFGANSAELVCSFKQNYPTQLRELLRNIVTSPETAGVDAIGELDTWIGECFRDAVIGLLTRADLDPADIEAIGSHGQTIRHRPDAAHPFTLQIGNPSIIASSTGIPTVADFRSADLALGGQGAPLVPPFHHWLLQSADEDRVVLNIGGIANVTVLPSDDSTISGFDTGPGNTLLDAWIFQHREVMFDDRGSWSAGGTLIDELLRQLLDDPWFDQPPPKSTGVEYFNLLWLENFDVSTYDPRDVQATLCEFTAASIEHAISNWAGTTVSVYLCGGGVHNTNLVERLGERLRPRNLQTTESVGLDPDWVEAMAFAWLAKRRLDSEPGNLPSVTGASRAAILGAIHSP